MLHTKIPPNIHWKKYNRRRKNQNNDVDSISENRTHGENGIQWPIWNITVAPVRKVDGKH